MGIVKNLFIIGFLLSSLFSTSYADGAFDAKKAEKFCNLGVAKSCRNLVIYYVKNKKDDLQAIFYSIKGCNLGDDLSCGLLGFFYKHPEAIRTNYEKSYKIFLKLAENGKTVRGRGVGYGELAEFYENGWYVKKDLFKAFSFYKKACELRSSSSCIKVGDFYSKGIGTKLNFEKALEYYGKACDMKNQLGCDKYANLKKRLLYLRKGN